ncbi:MAG: hypothetical protein OCD00_00045 [Colwellia sp.]
MRKVVFGLVLSLGITSINVSAQEASLAVESDIDCANFSSILAAETTKTPQNILGAVTQVISVCPTITDQVIELAISMVPATEHQELMQNVANTGLMQPADILLAAIAGGGNALELSEPTAGGNLSIVPVSAAAAPPVIGGRNGGAGEGDAASNN